MAAKSTTAMSDYAAHIAAIRKRELPSTSAAELYLDAAAAPPAPRSLLQAAHQRFIAGPNVSNPHSHSPSGQKTRDDIDRARSLACKEFFCVDRKGGVAVDFGQDSGEEGDRDDEGWELVFNSGTTAGLEAVARAFSYNPAVRLGVSSCTKEHAPSSSRFAYLEQSHSSLYGLRGIAQSRGIAFDHLANERDTLAWIRNQAQQPSCSLIALPLQCNATGRRYHDLLDKALEARRQCEEQTGARRVFILIDAAAFLSPSTRFPLAPRCMHQPDFVVFSFLKVLGYPSGLGGLLLQRRAFHALQEKDYYGGGSLEATTSRTVWRKPMREIHEALENGTQNLYAILSLAGCIQALRSDALLRSWESASQHTDELAVYLHASLSALSHADGSPLIEMYSARARPMAQHLGRHLCMPQLDAGPTVLFNVLRSTSSIPDTDLRSRRIDPIEVDRLACIEDVHLRSGRMCNVGAITNSLDVSDEDIIALWKRGIGCGTASSSHKSKELADEIDDPHEEMRLQALVSGALRASLSAWNVQNDIDRLCTFLVKHFSLSETNHVEQTRFEETRLEEEVDDFVSCTSDEDNFDSASFTDSSTEDNSLRVSTQASSQTSHSVTLSDADPIMDEHASHVLREVYIYPIKSCAAQRVRGPWRLLDTGLEHDRSMCVVDLDSGRVLSQKRIPLMARIRPSIKPGSIMMDIAMVNEGQDVIHSLSVSLHATKEEIDNVSEKRQFDMCGTSLEPVPILDPDVRQAFSSFLGRNCTLARMPLGSMRTTRSSVPLLLSNESPYLMVTTESIKQVQEWMHQIQGVQSDTMRVGLAFRANFVVSSTGRAVQAQGPVEAYYEDGVTTMTIGPHAFTVLGPCRRCEMIALDPVDGTPNPHVMSAVSRHRRCTHGPLRGRLLFGQHLTLRHDDRTHFAGDALQCTRVDQLFIREGMAVGLYQ